MATGKAEISIDKNPDEVWKLLREFGSLAEWMPGIDKCAVEGDVRTVDTMGIQVKEKLVKLDDDNRVIAYSITESPMDNLESHLCTISVEPEGSGSKVTWATEVTPDELGGLFFPLYEGSIVGIKTAVEG